MMDDKIDNHVSGQGEGLAESPPFLTQRSGIEKEKVLADLTSLDFTLELYSCGISLAELVNFCLILAISPLVIRSDRTAGDLDMMIKLLARSVDAELYRITLFSETVAGGPLIDWSKRSDAPASVASLITAFVARAACESQRYFILQIQAEDSSEVMSQLETLLKNIQTVLGGAEIRITNRLKYEMLEGADTLTLPPKSGWPQNLRVVVTTQNHRNEPSLNPVLYDHSFAIELDGLDLTLFPAEYPETYHPATSKALRQFLVDPSNQISVDKLYHGSGTDLLDTIVGTLEEVNDILYPARISFGYRTRNDMCLYMHFWEKLGLAKVLSATGAMDFCFLQKILPKINGSGEALGEALRGLHKWLNTDEVSKAANPASIVPWESRPWLRSAEKVKRMIRRLETEGATTFWGT